MKRSFFVIMLLVVLAGSNIHAQSPLGKKLGFGVVLGEPTGLTVKIMTVTNNAFVADLGNSYFGSPRLNVDYLWFFDAFNSNQFTLYAGPGASLGFGEGNGFWYKNKEGYYYRQGTGLGVRGVIGVNFVPQRSQFEIFGELGTLIGLSPSFGSSFDAAVGVRFYP